MDIKSSNSEGSEGNEEHVIRKSYIENIVSNKIGYLSENVSSQNVQGVPGLFFLLI